MSTSVLPDSQTPFGARVRERLRTAKVIWLTTVGADGTPQPNPVWFLWTEDTNSFLVINRTAAHRLTHVRHRPVIALHFDGNGQGGDIVVLRGTARRDPDGLTERERADYIAKYEPDMIRVSGGVEEHLAAYPVNMRVELTNVRGF